MLLKPKPNETRKIVAFRIFSIVSLLFSIFILVTEGTVAFRPEYTLMYLVINKPSKELQMVEMNPGMVLLNMLFTFMFLICVTLVCFFTIFNLKLSDYLQLVPRHTDCVTFSSITGFCCKIIVSSSQKPNLNPSTECLLFQLHGHPRRNGSKHDSGLIWNLVCELLLFNDESSIIR